MTRQATAGPRRDARHRVAFLTLALSMCAVLAVGAHHSFAPYYFEEQSVTVEGILVGVELKAPHAFIYLMARDKSGIEQRFSGEWASPLRLERSGVTKETLNTGDRLIVTGSPGRVENEYRIHVKRVERPADGWRWAGGRR